MIRVVLVDDHVVVRSGFAQLLSLEEDLEVVGQFSRAAEAWPALLRDDVDVAVMDIAMPDENGLSLLKRLRAQKPQFRAIILSIYDTPTFVQSALDAGASGYLTKRCGPEELVQAVRSVGMGGHYLCADALRALRGGEKRFTSIAPTCWANYSVTAPLIWSISPSTTSCWRVINVAQPSPQRHLAVHRAGLGKRLADAVDARVLPDP